MLAHFLIMYSCLDCRPWQTGPEYKWAACAGSDPRYRGYPCALWTLWHVLTVAAADTDPALRVRGVSTVANAMIGYIGQFFQCRDCAENFQAMAKFYLYVCAFLQLLFGTGCRRTCQRWVTCPTPRTRASSGCGRYTTRPTCCWPGTRRRTPPRPSCSGPALRTAQPAGMYSSHLMLFRSELRTVCLKWKSILLKSWWFVSFQTRSGLATRPRPAGLRAPGLMDSSGARQVLTVN